MYTIYMHVCDITGKAYVWLASKSIEQRFNEHVSASRTSRFLFHKAIRKYGKDSFRSVVLESDIDTLEEANRLEQFYIYLYRTFFDGYNMTIGGDTLHSSTKGKTYEEIDMNNNKLCVAYWMFRGYSNEEAKKFVSIEQEKRRVT